ncbi:uncharacterized protein LOC125759921 [Rhipicephalus sanguineus]|uniref:uncharacterized protein LOC125759921 n=1 Tax=Rhipicephalus sanguineus TaxID=34632 RepID=UPI0020C436D5|nr:uncharacterized protein LOC125759921 [Rhipicephalus sanguineus]
MEFQPSFFVMYSAPAQGATVGSYHGWQAIGDGLPSREALNAAAGGRRQRYRYRVIGFGCHTEYKTIEFLEELFATRFCSWCGVVAGDMYILSCMHVICPTCQERTFGDATSGFAVCMIDKEVLSVDATAIMPNNVHFKQVRCPCQGCDYTCCLKDLNYHMGLSCAFNLTTCTKCDGSVAHKDMPSHFWTCEGAPGVFLQAADVNSLLEDLGKARKELDGAALCSASASVLESVVVAVTEVFDRINSQLVMETPATRSRWR